MAKFKQLQRKMKSNSLFRYCSLCMCRIYTVSLILNYIVCILQAYQNTNFILSTPKRLKHFAAIIFIYLYILCVIMPFSVINQRILFSVCDFFRFIFHCFPYTPNKYIEPMHVCMNSAVYSKLC